jgi:predicted phage tail protein
MMRSIHLYGHLKKAFGRTFKFDVRTAGEALRALNCAFPGKFVQALQTGSYKVVRGDKRNGTFLDLELVNSFNLGRADLHIIPVAKGASNSKGTAKTILGVALIGGAIFLSGGTLAAPLSQLGTAVSIGGTSLGFTWGTVAAIGLGLTLSGISTLMSNPATSTDKTDSYSISGPTNTGQQGSAIPLVYGECIVGAIGVSFDADIENIGAYTGINDPAFDGTKARFPGGAY